MLKIRAPFNQLGLTLFPEWIINHMYSKVQQITYIHSQALTMQPLKFGTWYVI